MPFGSTPAILVAVALVLVGLWHGLARPPVHVRLAGADGSMSTRGKSKGQAASSRGDIAVEPLYDFDWKTAEPQRFRPFKPAYNITMALRSDKPSDLIAIDRNYLDRVTHRRHLISRLGAGVHGCLPGGVGAVRELYEYLLVKHLPTRFPTLFTLSPDKTLLTNRATHRAWPAAAPDDAAAALRVLGETVEEDMFLLHETGQGHRAMAFVCCFPAGFDPSCKLGKLLRDIHAPVPSYDKIAASMERFFSRIQVGASVKRLNWTVQTDGELYKCEPHGAGAADAAADAAGHGAGPEEDLDIEQTYLRVELQTLTRLPRTQAILFSFKTYLYPLRQVKEEGLGPELAEAVDGLSAGNAPGMVGYKGRARWSRRVCEYLRA